MLEAAVQRALMRGDGSCWDRTGDAEWGGLTFEMDAEQSRRQLCALDRIREDGQHVGVRGTRRGDHRREDGGTTTLSEKLKAGSAAVGGGERGVGEGNASAAVDL